MNQRDDKMSHEKLRQTQKFLLDPETNPFDIEKDLRGIRRKVRLYFFAQAAIAVAGGISAVIAEMTRSPQWVVTIIVFVVAFFGLPVLYVLYEDATTSRCPNCGSDFFKKKPWFMGWDMFIEQRFMYCFVENKCQSCRISMNFKTS